MDTFFNFIINFFKIEERGSSIKKEIIGGLTTFFATSYVLIVTPLTLSQTGMDSNSIFIATALTIFISALIIGLYANFPLVLAPGIGMQAFFTYTICLQMNYSWQDALFATFVSSIIFLLMSISGLRKTIINAIPFSLKNAITVGIGFFITFIGLKNAGIIISDPATIVSLGNLHDPAVLISICGTLIILGLMIKNNNYSIFIGLLCTLTIAIIVQLLGIDLGIKFPHSIISTPPSITPTLGQLFKVDVIKLLTDLNFWFIIISILFVNFFDTAGTIIAVGSETGTIDEDGNIQDAQRILTTDSVSISIGSILGVSSSATYLESLSGIKSGARTGLCALIVGFLFLLSIFFSPVLSIFVSCISAPVLITVGLSMSLNNHKINYSDFTEAISCSALILMTILSFSISIGIAIGFIVYTILNIFNGNIKKIHPIMFALCIFFIFYFIIA